MRSPKYFLKVVAVVCLVFIGGIGMNRVDVSVSALNTGASLTNVTGVVIDALRGYHEGLLLLMSSFLLLALFGVTEMFRGRVT